MKNKGKKIILVSIAIVFFLLIVLYLARPSLVGMYYGDLKSFDYYTGGGIAGNIEHYTILKEGDDIIFSASVRQGSDSFSVDCSLDPSVLTDIRNIIATENLFLRNGVDESEEGLYDGMGEALTATFTNATLDYKYYGTSVYRNTTLANYLLRLADENKVAREAGEPMP